MNAPDAHVEVEISALIDEVGRSHERLGIELYRPPARPTCSDAIEVEADLIRIGAEQTPTDEDFVIGLAYGNHAAPQLLHPSLGEFQVSPLGIRVVLERKPDQGRGERRTPRRWRGVETEYLPI
jgi:hypothetical protein